MKNHIENISPLGNIATLESLWLQTNFVRDLSALAGAGNLTHVYLALNHVSDLSPSLKLKKLKEVHATTNPLSDETYAHYIPALLEKGVKVWSGYRIRIVFDRGR